MPSWAQVSVSGNSDRLGLRSQVAGMADPGTISPAIDDAYWFAYSKEIVERALASRNEQAAKFQNLIAWLWAIYTAGAAVGLNLGKANYSIWITVLIALPSLILIVAYWFAVQAQAPVDTEFDPRSPTEIKDAYVQAVIQKKKQLRWAQGWSIAGGVFVAIALGVASFERQSMNSTPQSPRLPVSHSLL
jgi:hypothetical protein